MAVFLDANQFQTHFTVRVVNLLDNKIKIIVMNEIIIIILFLKL